MVRISIVVPVYNVEKYLKRCLDSLLKQTLKNIEIIVINDCSTDNSIKILQKYEQYGIKVINLEKNAGVSAARNIGIKEATGKYISFVDGDDWVDKTFCEKLYTAAEKQDADIAVSGIKHCHSNGIRTNLFKIKHECATKDIQEKFRLCQAPYKSYVYNKIYRLDKLKRFNIIFEDGMIYEDIIFLPQALYFLETLVTVPDTYYNYFVRPNSITHTLTAENTEAWEKAKTIAEAFCKDHNINADYSGRIVRRVKFCGVTVFKSVTEQGIIKYYLLNLIRWKKPVSLNS